MSKGRRFCGWGVTCSREIQQIRQITPRTPLVICSEAEEEAHIVSMLDAGANDYVFFSCSKQELRARLHGHTRRYRASLASSCNASRQVGPCSVLESEDQQIRLQCAERCIVVHGQMLRLTPIECTLLFTLMREGDKVLSHHSLLHAVWGRGYTRM
ncbi:response regulator transcription factor [Ktedonobacter robiniae]|uniref:response regulator transcription factor n=1 Tax=Ktedonobacter robiniae TaxID=2778365 RepID=UPI001F17555F|nr:winged helix-turn-helix domain-containing protein [Ktedonobacter robiniae]